MRTTLSIAGAWDFALDPDKKGLDAHYESAPFTDTILLPTTVSEAKKGRPSGKRETGYLTDPYEMSGYAWFRRRIELPLNDVAQAEKLHFQLFLERTRISHLWVDGVYAGTQESLVAPHVYDLTGLIHSLHPVLTILVDNEHYKIPGGHLTSPDTQTNWNGILGEMTLSWDDGLRLGRVQAIARVPEREAMLQIPVVNETDTAKQITLQVSASLRENPAGTKTPCDDSRLPSDAPTNPTPLFLTVSAPTGTSLIPCKLPFPADAHLWSEYDPSLYDLTVALQGEDGTLLDSHTQLFGLGRLTADGDHFSINGIRTLLRGKHDGMIFPLTGYAPMNVEDWLSVMRTAREYGINHYRFHTCCPPEAAFAAADMLGIYLQPELPFWGTYAAPGEEGYNEDAQRFLLEEGFRMLECFSSHPSYCMMSMGNELWGSPEAIGALEAAFKERYPHILYTQGSNNFQWVPNIQPADDFFSGVRFTIDRRIRGSYARCDKPLGHIQTDAPNTRFSYDDAIHPRVLSDTALTSEDGTVEIQYGTGVKRVKLTDASAELIPEIPVVSHEIGQYCTYPDYDEIAKYTGVLKAENLSIFKERLEAAGLGELAHDYFESSGALALACYKDELETAARSHNLAGYQILDLQDFTGQGTALVGMLNAFMENKGLVTSSEWREFCSDAVLQAEFDSYCLRSGETLSITASLAYFRGKALGETTLRITLTEEGHTIPVEEISAPLRAVCANEHASDAVHSEIPENGHYTLGEYSLQIPNMEKPTVYTLSIALAGTDIHNHYTLWVYPDTTGICDVSGVGGPEDKLTESSPVVKEDSASEHTAVATTVKDALSYAGRASRVVLYLSDEENPHSIEGTYCTDFWCYPMFRSISESMGRELPTGTLGLLIDNAHPALASFPCRTYSTPQWYSIVTAGRPTILDGTGIRPIVQTIDNFERNHTLGVLYEVYLTDLDLDILVCTADLPMLVKEGHPEAMWLKRSLEDYVGSTQGHEKGGHPMTAAEFHTLFSKA